MNGEMKEKESCIKDNDCLDSVEYIETVTGYRPAEEVTLEQLEKMFEEKNLSYWNYPLNEIEHIIENNLNVVLVRFPEVYGGFDYRFCEIPIEDVDDEDDED